MKVRFVAGVVWLYFDHAPPRSKPQAIGCKCGEPIKAAYNDCSPTCPNHLGLGLYGCSHTCLNPKYRTDKLDVDPSVRSSGVFNTLKQHDL